MKLWVPDIPDPALIDTDEAAGGWTEQIREIYEMENYTAPNVTVEPGDVCIDIGASIGMWSRWACEQGAARIVAFEPDLHSYKCLVKNSAGLPVETWNRAISNQPGPVVLFRTSCLGGHTLIDLQRGDVPITVIGTTLGRIIETCAIDHVDYLKIDCEGGEVAVFDGAHDIIFGKIRKIGMEYHRFVDDYYPGYHDRLIQRLSGLYPNVLERDNPGGQQSMIFAWR
jgi:FkbM family methyltransferase